MQNQDKTFAKMVLGTYRGEFERAAKSLDKDTGNKVPGHMTCPCCTKCGWPAKAEDKSSSTGVSKPLVYVIVIYHMLRIVVSSNSKVLNLRPPMKLYRSDILTDLNWHLTI